MKRDHGYGVNIDYGEETTETESVGPFYTFDLVNIQRKKAKETRRKRFDVFLRTIRDAVAIAWKAGAK